MSERTTLVSSAYAGEDDLAVVAGAISDDGWPVSMVDLRVGKMPMYVLTCYVKERQPLIWLEYQVAPRVIGRIKRPVDLALFVDGGDVEKFTFEVGGD